ncbi:MAG TPA: two-component regulator propeller domain-containing protein [Bacteroidota bacterium]|nr:two-component regulator propeller domain-containing protein [Bacteroidota bacterium]
MTSPGLPGICRVLTSALMTILLLSMSTDVSFGQRNRIRFEVVTGEGGSSQNSVQTICQDSRGFLWFGSYHGLARYDGYRFVVFEHRAGDTSSLSQNSVRDIIEDRRGQLWVSTENGLNRFNRETEAFTAWYADARDSNSLSSNSTRQLLEDSRGNIWIATDHGLNRLDLARNTFVKFLHNPNDTASISSNNIQALFEDHEGKLWVGTDGGLDQLDPTTGKARHFRHRPADPRSLSDNRILCIEGDHKGNLWVGTEHGGLNRLSPGSASFTRYLFDPSSPRTFRSQTVSSILEDRAGDLWIGTYGGGLERCIGEGTTFVDYQNDVNDPTSISSDMISCLFQDRSGILYVGTDFGGVNKIDMRKNQFTLYLNDPKAPGGLTTGHVSAFCEDPASHGKSLWVGTWGGGLGLFDRVKESFTCVRANPSDPTTLSDDVVKSIFQDRTGALWVGTSLGVNKRDPRTGKFTRYGLVQNNPQTAWLRSVFFISEDRNGNVWLGTEGGGLGRYDRKRDAFEHYVTIPGDSTSLNDNYLWCMHEDGSGTLWIGTNSGGLNCLDYNTGRFTHYKNDPGNPNSLDDNKILCMCEDHEGILWLGTASGGLTRFDQQHRTFRAYTMKDGLASNAVHGILEDHAGYLWLSGLEGLSRFDPRTGEVVNYSREDGLQGNEFHVGACLKSVTGEMFFGGLNGFNVFVPDSVRRNTFEPPVVITDFQLYNASVATNQSVNGRVILRNSITETGEISLSYRDEVLSMEFAALDFAAPAKNHYAYMMEGIDKDWNFSGNRHFVTYTKLPAGDYTFRVRGSNNNGAWNDAGVSLRIRIAPPFWETWWFRVLGAVMLGGILVGWYRWWTNRIVARNRELEQHVKERTAQLEEANSELEAFSYSVSHDLRTPLRAIDGYSRILIEDYRDILGQEGTRVCDVVRSETQRMGQLIDGLLKLSRLSRSEVRRTELDMGSMVRTVFDEITTTDDRKRIRFSVEPLPPSAGDSMLIHQVLVNLLSNAVKFTSKTAQPEITVSAKSAERETVYAITDNGAGFDAQYADKLFKVFQRLHGSAEFEGTGIGLAIVQRVIHRHGGKVWAVGEPEKGATFYFTLPRKAK